MFVTIQLSGAFLRICGQGLPKLCLMWEDVFLGSGAVFEITVEGVFYNFKKRQCSGTVSCAFLRVELHDSFARLKLEVIV